MGTRVRLPRPVLPVAERVLASAVLFGPTAPAGAAEESETLQATAEAAAERAVYNLPTDPQTMAALAAGLDVGTAKWGIAMTAEEEAKIDIPGRMRFVSDAEDRLLPRARMLPQYAGSWIDQSDRGGLVVMLTEIPEDVLAELESLVPDASRGFRIERVQHSYQELLEAVERAADVWAKLQGPRLLSVYIDERSNGLVANVLAVDGTTARELGPRVASLLGVPVSVVADAVTSPSDVACTTRSNCSDPYKAGVLIREGSVSGEPPCTLAFPIVVSGDIQVVTAGHCGHYGTQWYHPGGRSRGDRPVEPLGRWGQGHPADVHVRRPSFRNGLRIRY